MEVNNTIKELAKQQAQPKLAALKKATDGFEAMFYKNLLSEMQKSVQKTQFGDQTGSEVYQDMFSTALAESASKSGSLGISKMLYNQLAPKLIAEEQARLATSEQGPANSPEAQGAGKISAKA